jgi:alpha-beta hydrolase superfamily lysophospholipase
MTAAAPGPATPTRTLTLSSGGETLHAEWFAPVAPDRSPAAGASPRGVAVMVHGYAEHTGRYREVANVLAADGWGVLGFDQRGHGKSTGRRGHVERFTDYLDDLDAARTQARALGDAAGLPARNVVVAHSNGSLITLRALTDPDRRIDADAAVVSSPFLALKMPVSGARKLAARIATRLVPAFAQPNGISIDDLTHDAGKLAERRADTLCHSVATARYFTEAMAAQEYVAANLGRLAIPTLWLVGADDKIANPERSRALGEKLAGATYHHLAGMYHEVFNEVERAKAFGLMVDYLRAPAAKAA